MMWSGSSLRERIFSAIFSTLSGVASHEDCEKSTTSYPAALMWGTSRRMLLAPTVITVFGFTGVFAIPGDVSVAFLFLTWVPEAINCKTNNTIGLSLFSF
jgi:hypothetical protein